MTAPSTLHNELSSVCVKQVIGPALRAGVTYTEFCTLYESIQLAFLESLTLYYNLSPQTASGLIEASLDQSLSRFAALRNKG